jgi:hypothetical protein
VDEAAQALEPAALIPMPLLKPAGKVRPPAGQGGASDEIAVSINVVAYFFTAEVKLGRQNILLST